MKNLKIQIENYKAILEQEQADKEVMLELLETYDNLLVRENRLAHFTASSMVFNNARDKVLMIYHNIYDSWAWTGGHADGDADLLHVAKKELEEETGLKNFELITQEPVGLDTLCVIGHIKRGKYVPDHLHINLTYAFTANEKDILTHKPDENSGVKWIAIKELDTMVREKHMLPVYKKIINRVLEKY